MELAKPLELGNLKFSEPSSINIGGLKKITIRKDGKPLVIPTGKCFSYGVKKDTKYKSKSMSLVLDDVTVRAFEEICSQCEKHLGKPLSKTSYRRDDGTVMVYAKLKMAKGEIVSKFYKDKGEIDPMTCDGKHCEVKAALAIEGVILSENNANLQVKIHEVLEFLESNGSLTDGGRRNKLRQKLRVGNFTKEVVDEFLRQRQHQRQREVARRNPVSPKE